MKSRAAFLSLLCWLCVQCEPARERTPTRPPVRDVLATFEAARPKVAAFNRLSEEEKWEFLRLYLPNRVFHLPPSAWFKLLPDGTALVGRPAADTANSAVNVPSSVTVMAVNSSKTNPARSLSLMSTLTVGPSRP